MLRYEVEHRQMPSDRHSSSVQSVTSAGGSVQGPGTASLPRGYCFEGTVAQGAALTPSPASITVVRAVHTI